MITGMVSFQLEVSLFHGNKRSANLFNNHQTMGCISECLWTHRHKEMQHTTTLQHHGLHVLSGMIFIDRYFVTSFSIRWYVVYYFQVKMSKGQGHTSRSMILMCPLCVHAYSTDSLDMWHKYNPWNDNVSRKAQGHTGLLHLKCWPVAAEGCHSH